MPHRHFSFEIVEALARLNSQEQIAAELASALPHLGFSTFVLRETPAQLGGALPDYVIDNTPPGWRETYIAEGFYKTDHVVRHGRRASTICI
ncbi:MAG: autoinducer binding domain-containing protein [Xanthobacteraceae bacterium]